MRMEHAKLRLVRDWKSSAKRGALRHLSKRDSFGATLLNETEIEGLHIWGGGERTGGG